MYFTAPLVYIALRWYPQYRKWCSIAGFLILQASLIGASFGRTVPQLLATQGFLYAIGGSLYYFPTYIYMDEWFVRRRGLAWGFFIAGEGLVGIIIPFALEFVLHKWGFRTTLRVWSVVCLLFGIPALYFLKSRVVSEQVHNSPQKIEFRFLKSRAFWILQTGNIIQSLGFFMPTLYMPCKFYQDKQCDNGIVTNLHSKHSLLPAVGLLSQAQSPSPSATSPTVSAQHSSAGS